MNSRRGRYTAPRALFITFYFINRSEKKAVDREHHSSGGVHFEFHVSKLKLTLKDLSLNASQHAFTADRSTMTALASITQTGITLQILVVHIMACMWSL